MKPEGTRLDVITHACVMLLLLWVLTGARTDADEYLGPDPEAELEVLSRQLDIERNRESGLDSLSIELAREIASLSERIVIISEDIRTRNEVISAVEVELEGLEASRELALQTLMQNRDHLSAAVGVLARLPKNPPEALLLAPSQKSQLHLRVVVLSSFLSVLSADMAKIARTLSESKAVSVKHRRRQLDLTDAKEDLEVEQAKLERVLRRKSSLQAALFSDRKNAAEEVASLASKAEDLEELVATLKTAGASRFEPMVPSVSRQTNPDATQRLNDSHIALTLPSQNSLPYPTEGPIIRDFGERLENGTYSQGILVQAGGGAYVVAPMEGQIVFSGNFRTYGRLLIIEHTGGYHSLLGGFSRIFSRIGDWVSAGEPVGVMGDEERQGAVLYVEVRLEGEPVSPRDWLELIDRKVNG